MSAGLLFSVYFFLSTSVRRRNNDNISFSLVLIVRVCAVVSTVGNSRVCVCVFYSHSFWTSMDVPAGVTQEEGLTGFFIHLPSAVRALIFLARSIQPFLSLVDREVEFCVPTIKSFSTRWAFLFLFFILFYFIILVRKIPFAGIELTSQRVRRLHGYL